MDPISRAQVEDFLYAEAALLDGWRLAEWAELFTEDGEYLIPSPDDPEGGAGESLYLVYDDRLRLTERARRLMKKSAHVEFPHSVTRRIVSNVRILECSGNAARVGCNFVAYRSKNERTDVFPGHAEYDLAIGPDGAIRIRRKRVSIDVDSLRAQGKVSIIL